MHVQSIVDEVGRLAENGSRKHSAQASVAAMGLGVLLGFGLAHLMALLTR